MDEYLGFSTLTQMTTLKGEDRHKQGGKTRQFWTSSLLKSMTGVDSVPKRSRGTTPC